MTKTQTRLAILALAIGTFELIFVRLTQGQIIFTMAMMSMNALILLSEIGEFRR